jgi:hypothetical protein
MPYVKKKVLIFLVLLIIALFGLPLFAENKHGHETESAKNSLAASGNEHSQVYPSMPEPGKKVPIGKDHYFIYSFDKKPKLGTLIMKVQIFTAEGKKCTSLVVKADSDMPSMRGAHETGARSFVLSEKGDYLLPVNIMMPGDWEIRLTIIKDGKSIFRGRYNFDV